MREIVLDTETTGRDPLGGHRIVELGAWPLPSQVTADDRNAHRAFAQTLGAGVV
jgi:DNA polymerase III epsilon subunit-like protein